MKVRITFSFSDLASFVQQQLETQGLPGASGSLARIEIQPTGAIQFFGQEGRLESRLPLKISAGLPALRSLIPGIPGGVMRLGAVEMQLMVEMSTTLQLDSQLSLKGHTRATYTWINPPRLGLAMLKVPVDSLLAPTLQRELDKVATEIDQKMIGRLPVKTYLQSAWEALFTEYYLEESPLPFFLHIHPSSSNIPRTALYIEAKGLALDFALSIHPKFSLSSTSAPDLIPPLPAVAETSDSLPQKEITTEAKLGWEELIPWLKAQDWPLVHPLQSLTVLDILPTPVQPEELALGIQLDVQWRVGPIKRRMQGILRTKLVAGVRDGLAHLYLKGPHKWEGRRLDRWLVGRLSSRRWQQLSQNLHDVLLDMQANWIAEIQQIAQKGVQEQGFQLSGKIETVQLQQIAFEPDQIALILLTNGTAQINLKPAVKA
ncbi:MAG: DUF4403 family protein [Bacteroidota bacterium]